ncbi:MAG: glycosyltransferase [Sporolactobacillus sp.]
MGRVKVLILTGSYGGGHEQAAIALEKAFNLIPAHYTAEVLDVTSLVPAKLDSLEKRTFLSGVTHFPSLYHYFYKKTQKNNAAATLLKTLTSVGITRLIPVIEDAQPDIIISTFPPASIMMSRIKQADWFTNLPFLTVITDYSVHSTWVNRKTDGYLVASDTIRHRLIEMNVDPRKIITTGIPILPDFSASPQREVLRARFGIPSNQKILLVMGGGCGIFSHFMSFLRQLEKLETGDLKIVIICGHNAKAYREFSHYRTVSGQNIQVLRFVHNMNEWMAMADLLITKPGGLTISEAIASRLPMIIYKPLGGQEADNTKFLLSLGISIASFSSTELITDLMNLLESPSALEIMRTNMDGLSDKQQISALHAVKASIRFLPAGTLNAMEFA